MYSSNSQRDVYSSNSQRDVYSSNSQRDVYSSVYFPEATFKKILEYCDDRIEVKQRTFQDRINKTIRLLYMLAKVQSNLTHLYYIGDDVENLMSAMRIWVGAFDVECAVRKDWGNICLIDYYACERI